jgi:Tol biopolymer transport system component
VLGTIGEQMNSILDPAISPDGTKVAFRGREKQGDTDSLWIFEGNTKRRLTNNAGAERHMVWSPKGDRIAFSLQNQGGVSNLFTRASDGSGTDQAIVVSEGMHKWSPTWSSDARFLVFHTANTTTQARDLWFVNLADKTTGVLVDSPSIEALPRMSSDGRFVAYQSDEGGKSEIYVTTFPKSSSKWKVSVNGGIWAKWGRNEIFFWEGNTLMVAKVNTGSGFSAEAPQKLFTDAQVGMAPVSPTSYNPAYDVSSDGTRIVVAQRNQ